MGKCEIVVKGPTRELRAGLIEYADDHPDGVDLEETKSSSGLEIITLVIDNIDQITTSLTVLLFAAQRVRASWNGKPISVAELEETAKGT